jgi:ribose transport system permease protein
VSDTSAAAIPAPKRPALRGHRFGFLLNLTLLALLVVLWLALSISTDSFATFGNFENLLRQDSMWSIMAVGQTFVIITAGIDLSVGAVVGLTSTIIAMMLAGGVPIWAAILVTLFIGVILGAINAFGIVNLRLPPFIMTLATMTALRSFGLLITDGQTVGGLPLQFILFSSHRTLGIPNLFIIVILIAIPCYFLLHRLSGVSVNRTIYLAYIVSALLASVVGVLVASRIGIGVATTGQGWELQSIASSVIGGASLFGAVGSVIGPLLGAMLLTTINNGANLLNVNPFWQGIITGLLIIVIVYFDQLRRRKTR